MLRRQLWRRYSSFPVCPVSFNDEEWHQQNVNLKFHEREAVLETVLELLLYGEHIRFTEDDCVLAHQLEDAAWPYRRISSHSRRNFACEQ